PLPVHFADSGVDALAIGSHKIGGPYGIGALLLGRNVECTPILHGGGQERDVRSGTLDVSGAVGLAVAVDLAGQRRPAFAARLAQLRADLVDGIRTAVPDAEVNGDPVHHLPGIAH